MNYPEPPSDASSSDSPRYGRLLVLAVKLSIAAVVTWFISRSFLTARQALVDMPQFAIQRISIPWLFASGICYLSAMIPMATYWYVLNQRFGQTVGIGSTFRAYMIGHLGKYVPGKAMVIVLRTGFLRRPSIQSSVIAATVFIETFTMMAVGATLAAVLIGWRFADHHFLLGLSWLLAVVAAVPTWPPLLRVVCARVKSNQLTEEIQQGLAGYDWRTMLQGWALELVGWFLIGSSLACVMQSIPSVTLPSLTQLWPRLTASASLSMVAGFLSLLPGGLGVREAVLDQLLKQPFGPVIAFVAPILLRLVWLVTEVAISAILYVTVNKRR